jgi:hypothetical protein
MQVIVLVIVLIVRLAVTNAIHRSPSNNPIRLLKL